MNDQEENLWMMPSEALEWIENNIPHGSCILEFGSGEGSSRLSKNFSLFSVEHDQEWISKYETNYIYAPIRPHSKSSQLNSVGWYDVDEIYSKLPKNDFSLIIIDGPPKIIGRDGILEHLNILNLADIILIDDLHRTDEFNLSQEISKKCGLKCIHFSKSSNNGIERHFGVFGRQ